MKEKYTVGRHVPYVHPGAFDLEDCELFKDIEGAITDLIERAADLEFGEAGFLQLLRCKCQGNDVLNYEPIHSGTLVQHLSRMKKLK